MLPWCDVEIGFVEEQFHVFMTCFVVIVVCLFLIPFNILDKVHVTPVTINTVLKAIPIEKQLASPSFWNFCIRHYADRDIERIRPRLAIVCVVSVSQYE